MNIQELKIPSYNLLKQEQFYRQTLGLNLISKNEKEMRFEIGSSILSLEKSPQKTQYHFAINIPSNSIQEAYNWLRKKVPILPWHGNDIIDFKAWNAESVYFYDEDHNILELIARKNLNINGSKPFDSEQFLRLSEIGLPTHNVKKTHDLIAQKCNMVQYDGDLERFCALGDEYGLFIIVNHHSKKWLPTDEPTFPYPFELLFNNEGSNFELIYKEEQLHINH